MIELNKMVSEFHELGPVLLTLFNRYYSMLSHLLSKTFLEKTDHNNPIKSACFQKAIFQSIKYQRSLLLNSSHSIIVSLSLI